MNDHFTSMTANPSVSEDRLREWAEDLRAALAHDIAMSPMDSHWDAIMLAAARALLAEAFPVTPTEPPPQAGQEYGKRMVDVLEGKDTEEWVGPAAGGSSETPIARTADALAQEWAEWIPYPDSPASEWDRYCLASGYMALERSLARKRELLEEAMSEFSVLASYLPNDFPNVGLKITARAQARLMERIRHELERP